MRKELAEGPLLKAKAIPPPPSENLSWNTGMLPFSPLCASAAIHLISIGLPAPAGSFCFLESFLFLYNCREGNEGFLCYNIEDFMIKQGRRGRKSKENVV